MGFTGGLGALAGVFTVLMAPCQPHIKRVCAKDAFHVGLPYSGSSEGVAEKRPRLKLTFYKWATIFRFRSLP